MTDRDGDSRMQSLDESGSEGSSRSSSIFPHETVSTPPQSQPTNATAIGKEDTLMSEAYDQSQQPFPGSEEANSNNMNATKTNAGGDVLETDDTAPGWAWRNKRALEEYGKSSDAVLDRNFSLEEFGDVVLEQLREQQPDYDPYALVNAMMEGK